MGLYNEPLTFVSEQLLAQRGSLEAACGEPIEWTRTRKGVVSKAVTKMPIVSADDRADWPRQHAWLIDQLKRMQAVFGPPVAAALAQYDREAVAQ